MSNKLFCLISSLTEKKFKQKPNLNIDEFWNNLIKNMNLYDNFTFEFIPGYEPNDAEYKKNNMEYLIEPGNPLMIGNLRKVLELAYKIGILKANPELNPFRNYGDELYKLDTHVNKDIIGILDNLIQEEHFVQVKDYFKKN